jgi:hypothetical protein
MEINHTYFMQSEHVTAVCFSQTSNFVLLKTCRNLSSQDVHCLKDLNRLWKNKLQQALPIF